MTIRQAINDRLAELGLTRNALHVKVWDQIDRSHLYQFLAGKKDVTSEKLDHILAALDLVVVPRRPKK